MKSLLLLPAAAVLLSSCTILDRDRWPAGDRKILLTFDDGPSEVVSPALLDVLGRHGVEATFCYIGKNIEAYPELAERALREGHDIVIHTYSHAAPALFSRRVLSEEIRRCYDIIGSLDGGMGARPTHFRSPLGLKTPSVLSALRDTDLNHAYLTFYVNDAPCRAGGGEVVMRKIKRLLQRYDGGAIVLHEMRFKAGSDRYEIDKSWLPGAVEDLILWGRDEGFEFVRYRDAPGG